MKKLLVAVGCGFLAACSSPVPVDDAGVIDAGVADAGLPTDAGTEDAGVTDAGTADAGEVDSGAPDSGQPDAGPMDAGCVGTVAAQVAFISAPLSVSANTCTGPLKVQLQTVCGAAVNAVTDTTVAFSSNLTTTEFFGDSQCIGKPTAYVIPAGANNLSVYFRESAPGMVTMFAKVAGLDGGSQVEMVACAANEKLCNGNSCIPMTACCTNADCTGAKLCNAAGECHVPSCGGFPAGCSNSDYMTFTGTIVMGSSGFTPKCVKVGFNASVDFSGSLHSLEQTCGPKDVTITKSGSTYTAKGFDTFGNYGFHCGTHPTDVFQVGAIQR